MGNDKTQLRDYSLIGMEAEKAIQMGLADADWYQSPVSREKMRELLVRKNGPAIRDTLLWFALIFGSAYLVFLWWGSWLVIFPYIVYSVLYASTSDSRWHESSHGTAFKTDWMNNALYEIASFMVFRQSLVWRWSHARHHSDTIIRGRDPEIAVPRPPSLRKMFLTLFGISGSIPEAKKLIRHISGKIDPEVATYVPVQEYQKVFFIARIYGAIYLTVILLSVFYGTVLPLMFIGLPTLFGTWLMPVYGWTQHAGLQENVLDHRLNCRTVYMNRIHRFLYWNMNYHVEHHMFPLVPYHALPKLHELVKNDCPKPYQGIIAAFQEIIPAILKQRKDPTYFVERKLPVRSTLGTSGLKTKFVGNTDQFKDGWVEVCSDSELKKGEVIRFDFNLKTYAISRTDEGKLYATDGICSHGNAHLGDGLLIGNQLECSKHNGRFDLKDGSPKRNPVCVGIKTYEVISREDKIYLKVGQLSDHVDSSLLNFSVVSNRNLTAFIKELVLEPLDKVKFEFKPGQYIQLEIPPYKIKFDQLSIDEPFQEKWSALNLLVCFAENTLYTKRNYSLASNPESEKRLRFNVRISPPPEGTNVSAGVGSSYVFRLKPGDQVKLHPASGDFLIKPGVKEMVYIGGGAGMAPIRSHISSLLETEKTERKISFWYGARSKADVFYQDYFEGLQAAHPNFTFQVALSEPVSGEGWAGKTGYISDVLFENYLNNHDKLNELEFYLCGPPAMIKASMELLEKLGVAPTMIAFDEF